MKPIPIKPANAERIESALDASNGRAVTHTYQSYHEIATAADDAERYLAERTNLPASARAGATAVVCSGPPKLPASYRGLPICTVARLRRTSAGWSLTSLGKREGRFAPCYGLTAEQAADVAARLRRDFNIQSGGDQ